ncbi:MAG: prepilin-type cleavage/methylation domain-containing protein [Epsilonproteobacteria bacterium]|nr:prepilin-type cleavage/methylation domain-containing protein [Campylobacterota bacterium]NPA63845.1 type II secretion system protein [Campylobacterota bacterium]
MSKRSFTLVEIIFALVIIGLLAMVAMPRFRNLTANSKISSELATASTIQSAIEDLHSDWIVNEENNFTWGNDMTQDDLNDKGYPKALGDCSNDRPFSYILKNSITLDSKWKCEKEGSRYIYRGPASQANSGVKENGMGKPDSNDCWIYDPDRGTFALSEGCSS